MNRVNLLLTTISIVCQSIQLLQGAELKWFLFNEEMYFIEPEPKFTSAEAQQYCIDIQMDNIIKPNELVGLSKLIIRNFEIETTCWLLEENFQSSSSHQCYALGIRGTAPKPCSSLKGAICKQLINGGILQYKNGTEAEVNVDVVNQFCHPQSNQHDDLLQYCLIKMNKKKLLR